MPPETSDHELIKKLLIENQRLLEENNKLLHKMRRAAVWGMVFRFVWFLVIFGLPIYFYLNYIKPNMEVIEERFNQFNVETSKLEEWYKNFAE